MDPNEESSKHGYLLIYRKNGQVGNPYHLHYGKTSIGSSNNVHIRLKTDLEIVEPIHCVLDSNAMGMAILENNSKVHPVEVNGQPVIHLHVLDTEDIFRVGKKSFKYMNEHIQKEDVMKLSKAITQRQRMGDPRLKRLNTRKSSSPFIRVKGSRTQFPRRRYSLGSDTKIKNDSPGISMRNITLSSRTTTPQSLKRLRFSRRFSTSKLPTLTSLKEDSYDENIDTLTSPINESRTSRNLSNRTRIHNSSVNLTPLNMSNVNDSIFEQEGSKLNTSKNMSRTPQNACNVATSNDESNVTPLNNTKSNKSTYLNVDTLPDSPKNISRTSQNRSKNMSAKNTPLNKKSTGNITPLNTSKINKSKYSEVGSKLKSSKNISRTSQNLSNVSTPINNKSAIIVTPLNISKINRSKFTEISGDDDATPKSAIKSRKSISEPYQPVVEEITPVSPTRKSARNKSLNIDLASGYLGRMSRRSASRSMSTSLESFSSVYKTDRINLQPTTKGSKRRMSSMSSNQLHKRRCLSTHLVTDDGSDLCSEDSIGSSSIYDSFDESSVNGDNSITDVSMVKRTSTGRLSSRKSFNKSLKSESVISEQSSSRANLVSLLGDYPSSSNVFSDARSTRRSRNSRRYSFTESSRLENVTPLKSILKSRNNSIDSLYKSSTPFDKKQQDYIPNISIYKEKGNVSLSPVKELKNVSKRSSKVGSTPKSISKSVGPVITDSSFDFSNNVNTSSLKSIVKSRRLSMKTPKQEEDYASFDFSNNVNASVKSREFSMKTPEQEKRNYSLANAQNESQSWLNEGPIMSQTFSNQIVRRSARTPKKKTFFDSPVKKETSMTPRSGFKAKTPRKSVVKHSNLSVSAYSSPNILRSSIRRTSTGSGARRKTSTLSSKAKTPLKSRLKHINLSVEENILGKSLVTVTPEAIAKISEDSHTTINTSLPIETYSSPGILGKSLLVSKSTLRKFTKSNLDLSTEDDLVLGESLLKGIPRTVEKALTGSPASRETSIIAGFKSKTPRKSALKHLDTSVGEYSAGMNTSSNSNSPRKTTLKHLDLSIGDSSSPGILRKSSLASRSKTPRKSAKSNLDLFTEDNLSPVVLGESLHKGTPKAVDKALTGSPASRETSIIAGSKSKTPRKSTLKHLDMSVEEYSSPNVLEKSQIRQTIPIVTPVNSPASGGTSIISASGSKNKTLRKSALKHYLDMSAEEYATPKVLQKSLIGRTNPIEDNLIDSSGNKDTSIILDSGSKAKRLRKSELQHVNLSIENYSFKDVVRKSQSRELNAVEDIPIDSSARGRKSIIAVSGVKSKTPQKYSLNRLNRPIEQITSPNVLEKSQIREANTIEDNPIDSSSVRDTSIISASVSKTKNLRKSLQNLNSSVESNSFKDVLSKSQSKQNNAIEDNPGDRPVRVRTSVNAALGSKAKTPLKRLDLSIENFNSPNVLEKSLNRETNSVENYPVDSPAEKEMSIDWSSGSKSKTPRRSSSKHLNSTVEEFSPSNIPVTSAIDSSAGNVSATIPTPGTKPKTPQKSSLKRFDLSVENCSSTKKTLGSTGKAQRQNFITPPGSSFKMRTRLSQSDVLNDSSEDITDITSSFTSLTTETTSSSSNRETIGTSSKHSLSSHSTSSFEILDEAPKEVNKRALKTKTSKKQRKSPLNDLSNVSGVKKLFGTPKIMKSPKNDLTDIKGVKKMFSTPKYPKSPLNDLSNVAGVKKLLTTPKITNSPKNDLTDIKGVKKMFSTPKETKSPLNDLSNVAGVKKMFRSPKVQNSPKNDLSEVYGVKKLFTTLKEPKSPINELADVRGVKRLYKTPKAMKYPKNDLSNVTGVRSIFQTPKERKSPRNDLTDIPNLRNLIYPRYRSSPKNDLSNIDGINILFQSPNTSQASIKDNLFDSLTEKKVLRTYRNKSKSPRKTMDEERSPDSNHVEHVTEWVNDQLTQFDGTENRGIRRQNTPTVVLENIENIIENIYQKETEERICSVASEDDSKEDIQDRANLSRTRRNQKETVENLKMKKSFTRSRRNVKEIASDKMEEDVKGKLKDLGTKKTSTTRKKFKEISSDDTKEAYEDQKEKLKDLGTKKSSTRIRKNLKVIPSDDETDEEDLRVKLEYSRKEYSSTRTRKNLKKIQSDHTKETDDEHRREKLKDLETNKSSTRTRNNLKPIPSDEIEDTDDEDSRAKLKGLGTKKSSTRTRKNLKEIPGDETDDEYLSIKLVNLRKEKSSTRTRKNLKEMHSDDTKETDDEDRKEKVKNLGTNKSSTRTRKNLKPIPSDDIKDTDDEDSRAKLKGLGTKKSSTLTRKESQSDDMKETDEDLRLKLNDLGAKKTSTRTRKKLPSGDTNETDDEDLGENLKGLETKKSSTRTRKNLKDIQSDDTKETDDEDLKVKVKDSRTKKASTRTRKNLKEIQSDDTKGTDNEDLKVKVKDLGTKKTSTRTRKKLKEIPSYDTKETDDEDLGENFKGLGSKKSSSRTRKNLKDVQSDDTKETDDEDLKVKVKDSGTKKASTRTRKNLKEIQSDDTKETDDEDLRKKLKDLGAKKTSTRTGKKLKEIPSDVTKETDDDDPEKMLNDLKPQLSDTSPSKITRMKGVATKMKVELLIDAPEELPSVSKNVRATRGISKKYKSEEWDTPTKIVKHEKESEVVVGTVKPRNSRKKILESEETVSLKSKTEAVTVADSKETVQIARRGRKIYDEDLLKTLYHETEITTRKPSRRGAKKEEDVENKNEKTDTKLRKITKRDIKNNLEDIELQMNINECSESKVRKTTRRVLRKDEDDVEQNDNKLEEIEHKHFAAVRKTTRKRPTKNEDVDNENEQDLPDIIEKKKTRRGVKKYDDGQKENELPENQKREVEELGNAPKRKGVLVVLNEDSEENAVPVARLKKNATKVIPVEAPEIRKSSRTRRK